MLLDLKNKQNYGTFIINSFLKLELLETFEWNFEANISLFLVSYPTLQSLIWGQKCIFLLWDISTIVRKLFKVSSEKPAVTWCGCLNLESSSKM